MALYRFQLELPLTTQDALERIRALARERPGFRQSFKESFGSRPERTPPFIGQVTGNDFTLYRDIRYRNSFLPRIRGHVSSCPGGTRIDVGMNLHPLIVIFILVWLGGAGSAAVAVLVHGNPSEALIPAGMCVFLVLITLAGFYPEAIKARRILEEKLRNTSAW